MRLPLAALSLLAAASLRAADLYTASLPEWGAAVTNGWAAATGGPYTNAWINGSGAVFEGAPAGVQVLAGGVSATNLAFTSDGWLLAGANAVTLLAPAGVSVPSGTAMVTAPVAGADGLVKTGAGTLVLSAANTYTGGTTLQPGGGTLEAVVTTTQRAFSSGPVSVGTGSTLQINLNSLAVNSATTVANAISGGGALRVRWTPEASAKNTYLPGLSGFTGTIELSAAGLTGDKWNVNNLGTLPSALVIGDGAQLFVNGAGSTTFSGGVTVRGNGNAENRGAIRATGSTLGGTVSLAADASIGPEGGTISGAVRSGAAGTQVLTLGAPNSTGNVTLTGVVGGGTGTLALVKTAAGTATLSAANTYTGGTVVSNGTLAVSNGTGLGTGAAAVRAGATLNLISAGTITFANAVTGTGRVLVTMSGGTQNTYVPNLGGFTGTLELSGGSSNKLNTTGLSIHSNAVVQVNAGAQLFVIGANSIPAPVRIAGTGNGESRGAIRLVSTLAGPVLLTADAAVGPEGGTMAGSISSLSSGLKALTVGTANSGLNATMSGVIGDGAGQIRLVKARGGDLFLTRANTFSGGTAVNAGRLVLSAPAATLGSGTTTVAAGAEVLAASGVVLSGPLDLSGDGGTGSTVDTQPRGALRLDGATVSAAGAVRLLADASIGAYLGSTGRVDAVISEAGGSRALSIQKSALNAPGTIILGAANTFTGPTRVHNGTLRLDHADALAASTLTLDAADAGGVAFGGLSTARVGGLAGSRGLALQNISGGAVALTAGAGGAGTVYSGVLSGAGALVKSGAGTLQLSGASVHAGGTVVTQGVLRVSGSLSHASRPVEIGPAATLWLDAGTLTASNVAVRAAALLTGCGVINGDLVNEGTVAIDCPGGLTVNGGVTNHGRMRFTGGLGISATGTFVNNGILDLITGSQAPIPGLVNHGTVLFADSVEAVYETGTAGTFSVSIASQPGHNYQLQRAASLEAPVTWADVGAAQAGTGGTLVFTDPAAGPDARGYYRFKVDP